MTNIVKTVALATTIAIGAVSAPAAAQAVGPASIVIVDMDRVLGNSAAGIQASGELKSRADAIQARLVALRNQYGAEEQNLQKTQPTAAGPAATAWEAKVKDEQARKQRDQADLGKRDQDFQLARQSVLKQINDAAQPIISAVMREKGANIVLAEGATLQHTAGVDITNDVIARLNKSLPRVSTATPAAPAAK